MDKKVLSKEKWSEQSRKWSILLPPERPSRGEIEIYEDYLKKVVHSCNGKCKALILGATPELRDLLARYNIETTLADVNPIMVEAMNELLEFSEGKEKTIIANWIDIPGESDYYDVILCDHGLHWILYDDWSKFFDNKVHLLKKGGYFINNIVTMEKKDAIQDIEKIIEIYRKGKFSREDGFYYYYRAMVGLSDIENKKYYKDLKEYTQKLEKLFREKKISKEEYEYFYQPWDDFKCLMPTKDVVDEALNRYFTVKSVQVNFEHPVFTCHKIYFCKVKK